MKDLFKGLTGIIDTYSGMISEISTGFNPEAIFNEVDKQLIDEKKLNKEKLSIKIREEILKDVEIQEFKDKISVLKKENDIDKNQLAIDNLVFKIKSKSLEIENKLTINRNEQFQEKEKSYNNQKNIAKDLYGRAISGKVELTDVITIMNNFK